MLNDNVKANHFLKKNFLKLCVGAVCICIAVACFYGIKTKLTYSQFKNSEITVNDNGITLPKPNVSLSKDSMADMLALFIYQGGLYVQNGYSYDDIDVVGEYLGKSTGLIDEWTPKDGYVELAGTISGDFYSVKGYDPSFMLCMKMSDKTIMTFVRVSDITLKYGRDLFEEKLRLSKNTSAVMYESRTSRISGSGKVYQLNDLNSEIFTRFMNEINSAKFMLCDDIPLEETESSIYDKEAYRMYFKNQYGLNINLILFNSGYIVFDGLNSVCVKISEDTFNELISSFNRNENSTPVTPKETLNTDLSDCKADSDFGKYIPSFIPDGLKFSEARIMYRLDEKTADEIGTDNISIFFKNETEQSKYYYLDFIRADDYGKNGWMGGVIDSADLNRQSISEYFSKTKDNIINGNFGVRFDDIIVVISSVGIDSDTVYEVLSSIEH